MALKRFVSRVIRLSLILLVMGTAACMGMLRWLLMSPETLLRAVYILALALCGISAVFSLIAFGCGFYGWIREKRNMNHI